MTWNRCFALLPNGFFQQQRSLYWSTDKSLWGGFLVQALLAFAHIGYELMRRCWLCNYSCIAGFVVLVLFSLRRALPSLWSSSLRTLCSAVWYWRLLASRSRRPGFEPRLCFLPCFCLFLNYFYLSSNGVCKFSLRNAALFVFSTGVSVLYSFLMAECNAV